MTDLTDLERRVIGECLRAAVEGPFFVWYPKEREPHDPAADEAWRARSRRHVVTTRERVERLGRESWGEFRAIFGLDRDEVARIGKEWPDRCEGEDVELAVNNAMNNLLGYPHRCDHVWSDYISVSPRELRDIYRRWRARSRTGPLPNARSPGEEYFFGLM
jgi:PAS domain-containing protein